jgi:hypothetical protein
MSSRYYIKHYIIHYKEIDTEPRDLKTNHH